MASGANAGRSACARPTSMSTGAPPAQPLDYEPQPPAATPLGRRAAGGMVWMMVQTVVGKAANFLTQLVLARLLAPEVFGQVAVTFTVATLANILQQAGAREILIQRQAKLRRWVVPATSLALVTGTAAAVLMIAASVAAARIYRLPQLVGLIAAFSVWSPVSSLTLVAQAILETQLRFRAVARAPVRWSLHLRRWRFMVGDSFAVMAAKACVTLISYGDYMMLGFLHRDNPWWGGLYYFAFNLSMQTMSFLGINLEGVLF